ncbi:DUF4959 domain-containing protein [Parabacteroides pacaensis]|uniref:DUF4959 domain-containing protein n=1 Tax=Parabacteroides pacaensis TaxID=2086575 RepID=UPI000D10221D|nr:DUF4959 domain-containing protein [Parabacteroides pacaensis]
MKNKYIFLILCFLTGMIACSETTEKSDKEAPGQIQDVRFVPLNGGGYFMYTIPTDPDFLYVKAEYTLDSGETIYKSSSTYADTLYIEGLGQVKEYEVKLYSVDRSENLSAPVVMKVTPLYPNPDAVLETLSVVPGFSSLVVNWQNELLQKVDIYIDIKVDGKEALKVYSSNLQTDRFMIENLEGKPHTVTAYVKDSYGNMSKTKDCGSVTPYVDGKISKDQWSFLRNERLYGNKWDYTSNKDPLLQKPYPEYQGTFRDDSLKNAKESHFEGRIEKFWDDEIDNSEKRNLNYFHTGPQSYPFSYFIDMGRTIQASRVALWQRDTDLYAGENVIVFEIWISDDATPEDGITDWEYVGTYNIVKPSDAILAKNEAIEGHHFILYPDDPKFTKPFRYLRFKAIKRGSAGNTGCMSEITVYGIESSK